MGKPFRVVVLIGCQRKFLIMFKHAIPKMFHLPRTCGN
jgi:hypothetical protein